MRAGELVAAYEHTRGYFAEHSTPERYVESNVALLGGAPLAHPPTNLRGVDPTARVHASATLVGPVKICAGAVIDAGVTVGPNVVVGEGARVARSIRDSVIWAGAIADARSAGQPVITGP